MPHATPTSISDRAVAYEEADDVAGVAPSQAHADLLCALALRDSHHTVNA